MSSSVPGVSVVHSSTFRLFFSAEGQKTNDITQKRACLNSFTHFWNHPNITDEALPVQLWTGHLQRGGSRSQTVLIPHFSFPHNVFDSAPSVVFTQLSLRKHKTVLCLLPFDQTWTWGVYWQVLLGDSAYRTMFDNLYILHDTNQNVTQLLSTAKHRMYCRIENQVCGSSGVCGRS